MNIVNVASSKIPFFQHAKIHDGVLARELPDDRADQPHSRNQSAADDEVRAEPIIPLALIKNHLKKAQAHAEQPQPDVIDSQAAQASAHQVGRVVRSETSSSTREITPTGILMKKIHRQV